ncbi:hypothetical protein MNBD_NITROSPINAE03-1524 [hydrothermal vent metagenome]|uniref:C4-type zinc ribbon domain-containing protein n=1 Tax=hydrothermal vent metagenome TaxID=652676 RepID=A0A3B1CHL2_9ZZZZ
MSVDTGQSQRKINPDLEQLVHLQKIDQEIARKTDLKDNTLPAEIEELRASYQSAKERLKKFDEELSSVNKNRKELELKVEETRDSIAKAKQKLPGVKTNVEYRAILKEQDNFEKKIAQMEDEQLELMEKIDTKSGERKQLEESESEEKQKFEVNKKEKEEAMGELGKRLTALSIERDEVITAISPDVYANYSKVSLQRSGIGVAEIVDQSCRACFQLIPPQLDVLIRTTDEIYQCPHCDRYLYHVPEEGETS